MEYILKLPFFLINVMKLLGHDHTMQFVNRVMSTLSVLELTLIGLHGTEAIKILMKSSWKRMALRLKTKKLDRHKAGIDQKQGLFFPLK